MASPSGVSLPSIPQEPTPSTMAQGAGLANELDIPSEAPPSYAATNPATFLGDEAMSEEQAQQFETAIAQKRKGALYLRPFTAEGDVDAVYVMFEGKTNVESLLWDIDIQPAAHISWGMSLWKNR